MNKATISVACPAEKNRHARCLRVCVILLCLCLCALLISGFDAIAGQSDKGYLSVTGPCDLQFPEDHGEHPGYRTEWWYYTGNLQTAQRRSFGFQLTIFRRQITPLQKRRTWPDPPSRWRTPQIYLGHAAVTDISGGRHIFSESIARGALGLAGVRQTDGHTAVVLNKWLIDIRPGVQRLQAAAPQFSFDLELQPVKPPVLHGDRGYSRKGDGAERASCYYSFTRLQTAGSIRVGKKRFEVTGSSWMDHEFSTASLQPGISGWDWFSLQLDNQADVMIYLLRQKDGQYHPASSGTLIDTGGRAIHLAISDIRVDVLDHWRSPQSKVRYPSAWKIRIHRHDIEVTITPRLAGQEMQTDTTDVIYWEGAVAATGKAAGRTVNGKGYVELAGYAAGLEALK